jgi:hypothetical protein
MGATEVQIYVAYRTDDAAGLALNISRGWARLAPDVALVAGPVGSGASTPVVPPDATILALVGRRWLRSVPGESSFFDHEGDALRRLLETALRAGNRIVPILFEVATEQWSRMEGELPPALRTLVKLDVAELRSATFSQDLQRLVDELRSPNLDVDWTEAESLSIIRIETAEGGPLKWWSNRDQALRVVVDGSEVGSLSAWQGKLDWPVAPGRHTVQVHPGPLSPKSGVVTVELGEGTTVVLECDRNIFTGGASLRRRG